MIHFRTSFILSILLFLSIDLLGYQAQTENFGKVKLTNGTVLKTEILAIDLQHNVTIGLPDNQQVTIPHHQVYKIKAKGIRHFGDLPEQKGFTGSISFGLLFGNSSENSGLRAGVGINGVLGYQLSNLIGLGLGAGAEFVNDLVIAPIYLRLDGQMLNSRVSPIYGVDFGGSFAWYTTKNFNEFDTVRGGLILRPGLGVRFRNMSNSLYFLVSYQVQYLTFESASSSSWWQQDFVTTEKRMMKNLKYTFGIRF